MANEQSRLECWLDHITTAAVKITTGVEKIKAYIFLIDCKELQKEEVTSFPHNQYLANTRYMGPRPTDKSE